MGTELTQKHIFHTFPVFFLWIVVLCKKNCFVNVCFVFLFIDDFFGVSFRFLFYNHPKYFGYTVFCPFILPPLLLR